LSLRRKARWIGRQRGRLKCLPMAARFNVSIIRQNLNQSRNNCTGAPVATVTCPAGQDSGYFEESEKWLRVSEEIKRSPLRRGFQTINRDLWAIFRSFETICRCERDTRSPPPSPRGGAFFLEGGPHHRRSEAPQHPLEKYGVAFVLAIIGFLIGAIVGGGGLLLALSGGRDKIYWSIVERHPGIQHLAIFASISTAVACGVAFAYLAFVLAG
jgi:hypothetical protein